MKKTTTVSVDRVIVQELKIEAIKEELTLKEYIQRILEKRHG